jgi:hypothetical protein
MVDIDTRRQNIEAIDMEAVMDMRTFDVPEPPDDLQAVRDREDDLWRRTPDGLWYQVESWDTPLPERGYPWRNATEYVPLREVSRAAEECGVIVLSDATLAKILKTDMDALNKRHCLACIHANVAEIFGAAGLQVAPYEGSHVL